MSGSGSQSFRTSNWRDRGASVSAELDSHAGNGGAFLAQFQSQLSSPQWQKEFSDLLQEPDSELRFHGLLVFAQRLHQTGEQEKARTLWSGIGNLPGVPAELREKAEAELKANFEYHLDRLGREACDYKMILPMMAGTVIGQTARAGIFSQLLGKPGLQRLPGWALSSVATGGSLLFEVPAFVAAQRALSAQHPRSFADDLKSSALTLGSLKIAGSLSGQAWKSSGLATKFAGRPGAATAQGLLHHGSSILGMAGAHGLEAKAGLIPDEPLSFSNLLASQISLSIGGSLGNRLLGKRWAALQQELNVRSVRPEQPAFLNFEKLGGGSLSQSLATLASGAKINPA